MNRKEHLLIIAMEECTEVGQRLSKALRFSLEEVQPGQELTNAERIEYEFNDLLAVIDMLRKEGHLTNTINPDMILAKKEKIEKYLLHSEENGTLTA